MGILVSTILEVVSCILPQIAAYGRLFEVDLSCGRQDIQHSIGDETVLEVLPDPPEIDLWPVVASLLHQTWSPTSKLSPRFIKILNSIDEEITWKNFKKLPVFTDPPKSDLSPVVTSPLHHTWSPPDKVSPLHQDLQNAIGEEITSNGLRDFKTPPVLPYPPNSDLPPVVASLLLRTWYLASAWWGEDRFQTEDERVSAVQRTSSTSVSSLIWR